MYLHTPTQNINTIPWSCHPHIYLTLWIEICLFCFVFPEADRISNSHEHPNLSIFGVGLLQKYYNFFVIFTWTTFFFKYNVIFLGLCLTMNANFSLERTGTLFAACVGALCGSPCLWDVCILSCMSSGQRASALGDEEMGIREWSELTEDAEADGPCSACQPPGPRSPMSRLFDGAFDLCTSLMRSDSLQLLSENFDTWIKLKQSSHSVYRM